MAKTIISKDKLLESGLHYGHQTKSWNPAMKPFIAMSKKNIHIIDLEKTTRSLENSYKIVKKITERRGAFLFVGTQKQSSKTVRENAERVGAFYIEHRWLGGLLTNFRTIQNSVNKLRRLERLEKTNFEGYTKKEGIQMKKQLEKLEKTLGGIKFMRRLPQAIFVTSIKNEDIAIKEAKKMKIPVFGIADTNVDPYTINFPIFGNDDANKSVSIVTTVIADAIASAKGEEELVAYLADDEIKIMGLEEKKERTFHRPSFRPREERVGSETVPKNSLVIEDKPKVRIETPTNDEALEKELTKKKREQVKQIKMRKELLSKLSENEIKDFDGIKLTELYGVGAKIEKYFLDDVKVEKINEISNLNIEEISEFLIEKFPGVKTTNLEEKKEKIISIIEEAKYIVSNS